MKLEIFNYVFKASTGIPFKSVERFSDCLRVLIHCLMPTFREHRCFAPWWSETAMFTKRWH